VLNLGKLGQQLTTEKEASAQLIADRDTLTAQLRDSQQM
jgi:hypothetical protein